MSKKTEIEKVQFVENEDEKKEIKITEENLVETVMDLTLPETDRLRAVKMYYDINGMENTVDLTRRLCMMYQMSGGIGALKGYIYNIAKLEIDNTIRAHVARDFCESFEKDEMGYKLIDEIYESLGGISVLIRVELVILLMRNKKYSEKARRFFKNIINDQVLEPEFRYKTILSLENKFRKKEDSVKFITNACLDFFRFEANAIRYRILAGQYLLNLKSLGEDVVSEIISSILSISRDEALDHNVRADAADVILTFGGDSDKLEARAVINHLGSLGLTRGVATVFTNAQNVHNEEIEKSVREILEYLSIFPMMKVPDNKEKEIDYHYVYSEIMKMVRAERDALGLSDDEEYVRGDMIYCSLSRIYLDRGIYSCNFTLVTVLLLLWSYICKSEYCSEMKARLLDELADMTYTCSSGYISRMANVISGYGEFSLRISWRDQIIANFSARLNSRIRDIPDPLVRDMVLEELAIDTSKYQERRNFLALLRSALPSIKEELYSEFREYMDDATFDLYLRQAFSSYEFGIWV
jgi:NAD kinase